MCCILEIGEYQKWGCFVIGVGLRIMAIGQNKVELEQSIVGSIESVLVEPN